MFNQCIIIDMLLFIGKRKSINIGLRMLATEGYFQIISDQSAMKADNSGNKIGIALQLIKR